MSDDDVEYEIVVTNGPAPKPKVTAAMKEDAAWFEAANNAGVEATLAPPEQPAAAASRHAPQRKR